MKKFIDTYILAPPCVFVDNTIWLSTINVS